MNSQLCTKYASKTFVIKKRKITVCNILLYSIVQPRQDQLIIFYYGLFLTNENEVVFTASLLNKRDVGLNQ